MKTLIVFVLLAFFCCAHAFAQVPPPPPTSEAGHGSAENQPAATGGSAPIGSGMLFLLACAAVYGSVKWKTMHGEAL